MYFSQVNLDTIYTTTLLTLLVAGSIGNGRNVTYDTAYSGESNLNAPSVSTRFLEEVTLFVFKI